MAYTYSKIATYTVGSGGVKSVDFLNIPQTYTDLLIKSSTRQDGVNTADGIYMRFNGVTTGYTNRQARGNGSSIATYTGTDPLGGLTEGTTYTSSTFANTEIYIPNYTSSNYKSISTDTVTENNATQSYVELQAVVWANTSPITSISFTNGSSYNWSQYSTFHLYGIKAEL